MGWIPCAEQGDDLLCERFPEHLVGPRVPIVRGPHGVGALPGQVALYGGGMATSRRAATGPKHRPGRRDASCAPCVAHRFTRTAA